MAIDNPRWGAKKIQGELLKAVTTNPTDDWTAQQLKEATPWDNRPKYLIRDNDSKYGKRFSAVAAATHIKELKTPFQAPKANAICERFIGSLKRECLDSCLILHPYQVRQIVNAYVAYYNQARPHQGIEQHVPAQFNQPRIQLAKKPKGKVVATPVLNGLHHTYAYASTFH